MRNMTGRRGSLALATAAMIGAAASPALGWIDPDSQPVQGRFLFAPEAK
jgi:hypothetical protein